MSLDLSLYTKKPGCLHCNREEETTYVFDANITSNLGRMADALGIYECLWHPEENNIKFAHQLIKPLTKAICEMKKEPELYKKYDAPNGWGTYKDFLPWLERLLETSCKFPDSIIEVNI